MIKRVVLGISGGVDSAVAACLLKNKGFEVTGLFMRNWEVEDDDELCSSDRDAEDAEWVCKQLNIPFHEVNFVKEYWNNVFSYLLESYEAGLTPNPDIYCNRYIKFDYFIKYAQQKFGAQAIATGHYARSSFGDYLEDRDQKRGGAKLLQAFDRFKDQTFFLSQISQGALQNTMFPLGSMTKEVVKKIAESAGLVRIARKEESTGICFIGKRDFSSFISQYLKDCPGEFVDVESGQVVGEHRGFHHWTFGQRAKIPGFAWRYYIASKETQSNRIYVARGGNHPVLFASSLVVDPLHWISEPPPQIFSNGQIECLFRFQHTKPLVECVVKPGTANPWHLSPTQGSCYISLAQPLRALTPGQFAVLYQGDECLGSASISRVGPSLYDLDHEGCRTMAARPQGS